MSQTEIPNVPKPKIVLLGKSGLDIRPACSHPGRSYFRRFHACLAGSFYSRHVRNRRAGGRVLSPTYVPTRTLPYGWARRLGLLSGLIGFAICTSFVALVTLFSGTGRLRSYLLEMAKASPKFGSGPEIQQQWDMLMSPQGFPALVLLYAFSLLVIFLIFSAIGGLLERHLDALPQAALDRQFHPGIKSSIFLIWKYLRGM